MARQSFLSPCSGVELEHERSFRISRFAFCFYFCQLNLTECHVFEQDYNVTIKKLVYHTLPSRDREGKIKTKSFRSCPDH